MSLVRFIQSRKLPFERLLHLLQLDLVFQSDESGVTSLVLMNFFEVSVKLLPDVLDVSTREGPVIVLILLSLLQVGKPCLELLDHDVG